MTVYGDLDVSLIDEMPPGRSPIQTRAVFENKRPEALKFMHDQLVKGRQAYVVYPLVEESEKMEDIKAATQEREHLQNVVFPNFQIGLLHGQMSSAEKDEAISTFRRGETQILVATTVIEVGVDIPNASVMLIEDSADSGT